MTHDQPELEKPVDVVSGRTILMWVFWIWEGSG
jgi:hypothetical protein